MSPCTRCELRRLSICDKLLSSRSEISNAARDEWQVHGFGRAQRNIRSAGDRANRVYVICEGWAFSFVQLPDGRRQIFAILIPGDIVAPMAPFVETVSFSVQALTDIRYCGYSASSLKARLVSQPDLLEAWGAMLVEDRRRNLDLIVDLGARSADERVAHLMLDLKMRLEKRRLVEGNSFPFPLSQRLIAAATALTPEHVSRVIGKLRSARVIDATRGALSILNLPALQRIGAMNF